MVVFEVVSPPLGRTDRIIKVREHEAVPSIRRYVIDESTDLGLMVLDRQGPDHAWRLATLTADEIFSMPEIGNGIPIGEFYADVSFQDEPAARA